VSEFAVKSLVDTPTIRASDVWCSGDCRHKSAEECATATHLVFPYRGTYVRHLGREPAVAESSQVLFFNAGEGYQVSHPVRGGDASVTMVVDEALLSELTPSDLLRSGARSAFREQRLGIDPRAQVLLALLRQTVLDGAEEPLQAENLALALVARALGPRTTRSVRGTAGRRRLVDRVKLVLASDLSRRWSLADVAAEVRCSPVYLTQVFQQVEGVPLYRYQMRLRLARALHLLEHCTDLTALGLELGFSSHSHFSAAFQQAYGRSPSQLRRSSPSRGQNPASSGR
jgi:AraC family transcriptional regulator